MPNSPEDNLNKLAKTNPRLTIATDHALDKSDFTNDSFNLTYRLGPIFDIIRHPDTKTPMAIAIYGSWGTGKTSAMGWLHGLLNKWNDSIGKKDKGKIRVKPVWFFPWKYHDKEDVWRGLIAEVIIESINVDGATRKEIINAAKQFGMFLGRSFVNALAGLTLKVKPPLSPVELEADLSGLKDILQDYRETSHPEKAFLNEFENTLETWIKATLGPNERIVIFIDDLDRCMPDIALEVLEALKLYLNIDKLIFVVGVDRGVISELVTKYYSDLGVKEEHSQNYLAKMFQAEVDLAPRETQIKDFLAKQFKPDSYWNTELKERDRKIFEKVILNLANHNPREVKRLLNSAIIAAGGFLMLESDDENALKFNQALQYFFIRAILQKHHQGSDILRNTSADYFFRRWSEIVRKYKNISKTVFVPPAYIEQQKKKHNPMDRFSEDKEGVAPDDKLISPANFAPPAYFDILENMKFIDYLGLLADEDLGNLMQIPFPETAKTEFLRESLISAKEADIMLEAIARELRKNPAEITSSDYARVTSLNLSRKAISDFTPLQALTNLTKLYLGDTKVADVKLLQALTELTELYLFDTQVADVTPLQALTNLTTLNLFNTKVADVTPLQALMNLTRLDLSNTQVADVTPLQALTNLTELHLSGTKVADVTSLQALTNMKTLYLYDTQVADVTPLQALTNLTTLSLLDTNVANVTPLQALTRLTRLYLTNTQVADVTPLQALTNLTLLNLSNTQVADIKPLQALTNLTYLNLSNTPVADLKPLQALTNLIELNLSNTKLADVMPLQTLTNLTKLVLSHTQVAEEQVKMLKEKLPGLEVFR